jgi:NADPH2:quinone reductase
MPRALVCSALSDDLSGVEIAEVPRIALQSGEVRVRVRAAALNFPDLLMTQGKYQLKPPLPFSPGMEASGEVLECAKDVQNVCVGDAVVVGARYGLMAEEAVVPAASLRAKPAAMSWAEAASFSTAWITAYVSLVRVARLEAGETLLVHGGAGGVGMAALDLGRILGAHVIATASTEEKRALLRARGAALALAPSGFRDAVKDATNGRGADVVFDPVGGDAFDESTRAIAFGGRLLVVGFASGRIPEISANIPLIKGFAVMGVRAGEFGRQFPEKGRENWAALQKMAEAGQIKPHIGMTARLDEAKALFQAMMERRVIGKAVVEV